MFVKNPAWRGLAAACCAFVALAGCNATGKASNTKAQARFVNLMSDPAKLSVSLAGANVASDLPYLGVSEYTERNSNTYTATVTGPGGSSVASHSVGLGQVKSTVFLTGSAAAGTSSKLVVTEAPATVTAGKFVVRTLRLSANLAAYDLYVTTPTADLATATATVAAGFAGIQTFHSAELDAGSYRVRLTVAGAKTVVFDTTRSFAAGTDNVLVLHSLGSATIPAMFWMQPTMAATEVVANPQARVLLAQGAPDVASARLELDGAAAIADTAYGAASAYATVASGSRAYRIVDASGEFVGGNLDLAAGHDYSVVLTGRRALAKTVRSDEDSRELPTTTARVFFLNATSDGIAVDAADNGTKLVTGIAAAARSAGKDLTAAAHPISFTAAGGTAVLAQVTSEALAAGGAYVFALVGEAGAYKIVSYKAN